MLKDLIFGTPRQTDYSTLDSAIYNYNSRIKNADKFYDDNFSDDKWNAMNAEDRAKAVDRYNSMVGSFGYDKENIDAYSQAFNQEEKERRHQTFGNGLLGAILNPAAQTFDAFGDLVTGNYDTSKRDVLSDIGAGVSTALMLIPGGGAIAGGAKAVKAGSKIGKLAKLNQALYRLPGSIGTGAAFGALDTLRTKGKDATLGDYLSSAGSGAIGGAVFGSIPIVNKAIKNRGANEVSSALLSRGMTPDQASALVSQLKNRELYQAALGGYGKLALGGAGLYGASRLLGGRQQQAQPEAMTLEDYYQMGGY